MKAPFSIATTPRCRGGCYSFPGLLHFILDAYLIMLSVKQGTVKYLFFSFFFFFLRMTRPKIELWSPGPLANTLLIRLICRQFFFHCLCFWLNNLDYNAQDEDISMIIFLNLRNSNLYLIIFFIRFNLFFFLFLYQEKLDF